MQKEQQMSIISILIPTYNESQNILKLIEEIKDNLPDHISAEIIVVDDNSPDRTGRIVEYYVQAIKRMIESKLLREQQVRKENNDNGLYFDCSVKVVQRAGRFGLVSAIMDGIKSSAGRYILVMDADFSHSPEVIPQMIRQLENSDTDIVVASRYREGGSTVGWPFRRRLISKAAIKIAQIGLGIQKEVTDPMSGFFAFKRHVIENIIINTQGYKILLEILVKMRGKTIVKEVPYAFIDRRSGQSKLSNSIMLDYLKAVGELYRYQQHQQRETKKMFTAEAKQIQKDSSLSLLFSQAGKFAAVGTSGIFINYLVSYLLSSGALSSVWYLKATIMGIIVSNTSNFLLNKLWTFEDRDFSIRITLKQYGLYLSVTSFGIGIQLGLVYTFVELTLLKYEFALILSIIIASISNFLLNKKWTFR